MKNKNILLFPIVLSLFFFGCSSKQKFPQVSESVTAGSSVIAGGKPEKLYNEGGNLMVGKSIAVFFKDTADVSNFNGKVVLMNVVPSVDTVVCEEQTHILGEDTKIHSQILRVTVSRDLPMAQARFAKTAKLTNIQYISDFKSGAFGKYSGLLMQDKGLLARAVIVIDQKGIVRYLQVVPDVATLPNMTRAIEFANNLVLHPEN